MRIEYKHKLSDILLKIQSKQNHNEAEMKIKIQTIA